MRPKVVVFASGTKDGGSEELESLIQHIRGGVLFANPIAVVSDYEHGGVREYADRLDIPFVHFRGPFNVKHYRTIVRRSGAGWVVYLGWRKPLCSVDQQRTFTLEVFESRYRGRFVEGPVFFEMDLENIGRPEHSCQNWLIDMVVNGRISWDGKDPKSLVVPNWYKNYLPKA